MNALLRGRITTGSLLVAMLALAPHSLRAADALTWQQKEEFLAKGKIGKVQPAKKGITGALRATLTYGTLTHDAKIQPIDESKQFFLNEVNFKDTYKFNIAGWKLAQLLGIDDMIAPSIRRTYMGMPASFDWWIEDIVGDEEDLKAKKIQLLDEDAWHQEYHVMEVFDQLIYNIDRNQGNILMDKNGRLWIIDHTRAFRAHKTLKDPSVLKTVDRNLLAKMKTLDEATLTKEFGSNVTRDEIRGLVARRDLIVKFFDDKGPSALYDRPSRK
jgi:hypothetical protein